MDQSTTTCPNPTIADVAEAAGVSVATVSRALNNRPDVANETRERVQRAAAAIGYHGRLGNRRHGRSSTRHITLLAHGVDNEYIGTICRGIMDQLDPNTYQLVLHLTDAEVTREADYVRIARRTGSEGLLVVTPRLRDRDFPDLVGERIPYVLIDFQSDTPTVPCLRATNWQGARQATNYLIGLGHRRIGYVAGRRNDRISDQREHGYRSALTEARIPFAPELLVDGDYSWLAGFSAVEKLLALDDPPTAIFASSDLMAFGAVAAVQASGRRVPDDVSIVGFDDIPMAACIQPPLTTIRQPLYDMGRMAAQMVVSLIEGQDVVSRQIELPTRLIVRQSCRAVSPG